ncbi:MAG: sigma-70 family RNA polymerase sigma factor [Bacteroides sp.]|nr:sigma-70 family RNA polymerase sigma factor [Roseburia sp.]MCM1347327.1 sigma-70 family RNA polymerase sigma factor [Bacteroides sp.]MCM1421807.1 sigma-70 family RNA polymerase sigma factor [Bacteroides sp.]
MTEKEYRKEVRQLRDRLIAKAVSILGNEEDAEDVVQDALLRLWQMHEDIHPPLTTLAFVIVRNLSIDHLRVRHPDCDMEGVDIHDMSPFLEEDERIGRMMAVVATLPGMQQTVLRLRHVEGMDMAQIAELTGSTEVAVRKVLSRARMTVRDRYVSMGKEKK